MLLNFSLGEKFWNFNICSLKNSLSLFFQSSKGPVECSYAWKLICSCTRTLLKCNLTIFLTKKIKTSPWHKGCFHIIPDRFLCRHEMLSGIIFIVIIIIIIRVCIHLWQRNPSLDWSYRCLCLANLDHTGPNCLMRSSLHLVFGRPCFLVQTPGAHSVALRVKRLSDSRAMWPPHLCFAFLIVLVISLTPVSCRLRSRCFAFDLEG